MIIFDVLFDAIWIIALAGGPTKIMLLLSHWATKSEFSDKNPNPGWIAYAPDYLQISIILLELRYDSRDGLGPTLYALSAI